MDFMPMASWDKKWILPTWRRTPLKSYQDPKGKHCSLPTIILQELCLTSEVLNSGSPFVDLTIFWNGFNFGIVLSQGFFQQRFQGTILINGLCLTSRANDSTLGWVLYQNGWSLPSLMSDEIASKHWFSRVNSLLVLQRVEAAEVFQVFLVPIILGDFCGRSYISPKLIPNIPIESDR